MTEKCIKRLKKEDKTSHRSKFNKNVSARRFGENFISIFMWFYQFPAVVPNCHIFIICARDLHVKN